MRDFLLFTHDCDGERYEGALSTLVEAKAKAVELWDKNDSYEVRKTSDDGFSVYGDTAYAGDSFYLGWSDEESPDLTGQHEKIARFKREAEERTEAKAALYARRDSGVELSTAEKIQLSLYETEDQMIANVFNNSFDTVFEYGIFEMPLVSTANPMEGL